jgi:hypothetical protein
MERAPKIYAEWVKVFDILKSAEDDENVLALMQEGEIVWQAGVAERFINKLLAAINFRLNRATDNFQKSFKGDENETIKAIMQLRKEFQYILKVVNIKALPEEKRKVLSNEVIAKSNAVQESLEKSSESDRTGKTASIIKNNKVNVQWEG